MRNSGEKTRFWCGWILFTSCFVLQNCHAQESGEHDSAKLPPLTEAEIERGRDLLLNYERNRKQVTRYACGMFVDTTREDFENPQATSHTQDWYFHASDMNQKISRQDELVLSASIRATQDGFEDSISDKKDTLFITDQQVIQVSDRNKNNSIPTKDSKDEDFIVLRPQSLTNPWMFAFHGSASVNLQVPIGRVRKKFYFDINTNDIRILNLDEIGRFTGVEFVMPDQVAGSWKAIFDKESGDMPVRVEGLVSEERYFGVIGVAETEWIHVKNAWLPQQVHLERKLGPPQNPVGLRTQRTDLYWVLGDDVPESVFVTTPPDVMRTVELKEAILQFAINRKK